MTCRVIDAEIGINIFSKSAAANSGIIEINGSIWDCSIFIRFINKSIVAWNRDRNGIVLQKIIFPQGNK